MTTRITLAILLLLSAALAIDAATSTQPAAEGPPPPITLFVLPPGRADQQLSMVLKEVKFEQRPLREVLDWIRQQARINLVRDERALADAKVDLNRAVSLDLHEVTVAEALRVVCLTQAGTEGKLGFYTEGNLVFLTAGLAAEADAITRIYDITDLVLLEERRYRAMRREDEVFLTYDEYLERIVALLQDTVAPDTWRDVGGSVGWVRDLNGRLIIAQTPQNHAKIDEFLSALRSAGVPPTPPTTQPQSTVEGAR